MHVFTWCEIHVGVFWKKNCSIFLSFGTFPTNLVFYLVNGKQISYPRARTDMVNIKLLKWKMKIHLVGQDYLYYTLKCFHPEELIEITYM